MNEQIKQDIDLIEILFYLKKKIRVILFIIAICMANGAVVSVYQ